MAAQHHKSEQVSTKALRYTVGYIRDSRKFQLSPSITLKGHWMGIWGLGTGRRLRCCVSGAQDIMHIIRRRPAR
ncbi:SymE family type I addiction module toxin [Erwinia psidii]|uniref:SymE family type I addiction module toxin n=1 Tax=Erwinia psidii TaxID=69224 RepID=UPI00267FFCA7|nr:SymE family type I addiction module toxin [Erwinia psidii]